jgi:hypothetical protein
MNTNELHEELLRMGRQPVPPPRQEFVEELLARINLGEDLPVPAPIQLVPRQPWIRFRMVAAGAVAAALLAAVGLFSLARENSGTTTGPQNLKPLNVSGQQVSATSKNLQVTTDGKVTGDSPPDGRINATCQAEARIKVGDRIFECQVDQSVTLTIQDGRVVDAFNETTKLGPQAQPAAKQTAAPVTAAPTTTSSATTTSAPPAESGSGKVIVVTNPTTPTTRPDPVLNPTVASAPPSASFDLKNVTNDANVTVSWPAYAGVGTFQYVVLQTISPNGPAPDTPTWSPTDPANVVATIPGVAATNYSVTLDGKGSIHVNTRFVSFRVAVVDNNNTILSLSNTLTLELKWAPLKPAGDPSPTTSSTTTTTTTTTAATATTAGRP